MKNESKNQRQLEPVDLDIQGIISEGGKISALEIIKGYKSNEK
tara:strand:+ start:4124 stop:4252 length:129 start_codon:yes stop_codon:yes gene_type:complete